MIMDMQIGLFCGVFSIIASLVVYAILSFYSIKEDSFDEAKANRRKLFKEYLDQRTNAEKSKQKKPKKVTKKGKDKKPEQPVEAEEKKETITPPEVPKEVPPQPSKESVDIPKKPEPSVKTSQKMKSHPPEKDDIVSPVSTAPVNNENNPKKVPEKKLKQKTQVQEKKQEVEPVQISIVTLPKEIEKKPKVETKQEKKKTDHLVSSVPKKQQTGSDKQIINVNSILSIIQKAELSRSEVQLLIDTLLNSEDETSDWLKVKKLDSSRQDNCVKLRKQLSEIELSLKNEKQITLSLQGKLKELRAEMASDKTSVSVLKESLNKIQQEKDDLLYEKSDLSYKLKAINDEKLELQEQLNRELAKAQQQQKIEDDHQHDTIMTLKEELSGYTARIEALDIENTSLKSTISCLEGELTLHQNCSEKLNGLERALNVLSEKINEKDVEILSSRKQLDSLSSILNKFKNENNDLKTANEQLNEEISISSKDMERLNEEIAILSDKLSSLENELHGKENGEDANGFNYQQMLEEKEDHLQQMSKQIDSNMKSLNEVKQELLHAKEENTKLKSMLDRANTESADLKENIAKLKSHKSENEHLIESLRNSVNSTTGEIALLKEEIEQYKLKSSVQNEGATNGISTESLMIKLEEKDSCLDQMTKQIDSNTKVINDLKQELRNSHEENKNLKLLLDKANSELAGLKENVIQMQKSISEAEEINKSLSNSIKGSNEEIKSLKEELEKYKERNNELRNKNWKVVQALSDAEKALQIKLKSEESANGNNHRSIEELKSNVNTFVRRLFPDVDIQDYKGHFDDWLRSVEDTISSTKSKQSPQELQSQNAHLQSLIFNYKKIISDTEHMLNELQNHVEVEEAKWREKCSSYEKEIESLRGQRT